MTIDKVDGAAGNNNERELMLRARTAAALDTIALDTIARKGPMDPADPLGNGGTLRPSPNDLRHILDRSIADRAARGPGQTPAAPPLDLLRQALARAEHAAAAAIRLSERLCGGDSSKPKRDAPHPTTPDGVFGEIEAIAGQISRLADATASSMERIEKRGGF